MKGPFKMKRIQQLSALFITETIIQKRGLKSYAEHIPTSLLQKVGLTVGSAFMALSNPERGDMVAILGYRKLK